MRGTRRAENSPVSRLYVAMKITAERTCPICGSRNVRRSRRFSPLVALLRLLFLDSHRCRSSFRRFYKLGPPHLTRVHSLGRNFSISR